MYNFYFERPIMAKKSKSNPMVGSTGFAGMPGDVKYHGWPEKMDGFDFDLDDTISGVNAQMSDDRKMLRKVNSPHKY